MEAEKIYTNQVAARWDVHPRTVTRYVNKGKLAPIGRRGLGGEYVFVKDDIIAFERDNNIAVVTEGG